MNIASDPVNAGGPVVGVVVVFVSMSSSHVVSGSALPAFASGFLLPDPPLDKPRSHHSRGRHGNFVIFPG